MDKFKENLPKRFFTILLCCIMVLGVMPTHIFANAEKLTLGSNESITKIAELSKTAYSVDCGTKKAGIGLPDTVPVTITKAAATEADQPTTSTADANVVWNGTYDGNTAGKYTLTAAFADSGLAVDKSVVYPTITVTVNTKPQSAAGLTSSNETSVSAANSGATTSMKNSESTAATDTVSSGSKMPAHSFTGYASNGVTVVADADKGVFPAGVTMQVTAVSKDKAIQTAQSAVSGKIVDAAAVDIKFYDADRNEIEPADNTQVHVTLTARDKVEGSKYTVVHIKNSGAKKIADASATGASFNAGSFSIYAIIGQPDGKATTTYEFYNDALTPVLLSTSIVKDGDTLDAPGTPVSAADSSASFLGWSTKEKPTEYQTFGKVTIPSTTKSDTTVKLYARFCKTCHVFFHNQYGVVIQSFSVNEESSFHVADYNSYVTFPIPVNQSLTGWSTILAPSGMETGLGGKNGTVTDLTITKNVDLYPVLENACWIAYDSNGGSYTAPESFHAGISTKAPTDPTRSGYTFDGWYTDETLTQPYTFGSPLSANITLHAKWKANEVNYTVIYWVEALDSNKNYVAGNYEYKESSDPTKTQAIAGSQVTINASNVNKSYPYYTFDHGDQNVTIDGDGSTVVNAYFRLNTYTFNFNLDDVSSSTATRNSTLTISGNTYTASNPYSFKAHFGENIAGRWPTAGNIVSVVTGSSLPSQFYGWTTPSSQSVYATKRLTVTADLLSSPDDNSATTYKALFNSSLTTYTINYWLENADDTGYTKSAEYSQEAGSTNGNWSAKQIGGFANITTGTPDGYPANDTTTTTRNFYYTRNTYSLEFSNGGTIEKTVKSIKFGSRIAGYDYTPDRPSSLSSDYQFGGWYTTPKCLDGTKFDFSSAVMPYRNLILYAKWVLPDYTVRFDLNGGTSSKIADQTDVFRQRLFCPDPPTRSGYVFSGWTLGGKAFNFDSLIAGNILNYAVDNVITLQAQWIGGSILHIKYDAGKGTTVPTDSTAYYSSANAVVAKASKPPNGKYFRYWTLNGTNYYPGDTIKLDTALGADGIITLTAVYGKVQSVSITYHPNGGSGSSYTTDLLQNNTKMTILACNDSKIYYRRDGYRFTGWNTKADGSGTSYEEGTTVRIDNFGKNDLYAQWIPVKSSTSAVSPASNAPGTGDNSNLLLWFTVMLLSSMGLGAHFITRKKKNESAN